MKISLKPRQSGKTAELIKKSAETGAYIVCRSLHQANRLQMRAKSMGLEIPLPISYDCFIHKRYAGENMSLLIDDADMLLIYMSLSKIDEITMSEPQETTEQTKAQPNNHQTQTIPKYR